MKINNYKFLILTILNLSLGLALLLTNSKLFYVYIFVNFCLLVNLILDCVNEIKNENKKDIDVDF
jgi:hypothetical protein